MTNPFHTDWLRRFREDLRQGDMDSLTQHVELAGLEVVLDPDFLALASQEDARSVVVLIATLGEANSEQPKPYSRWLASYQYLQHQLDLDQAAQRCTAASESAPGFYAAVLDAAKHHSALGSIGSAPAHVADLQFGIDLLVNTGHSGAMEALLEGPVFTKPPVWRGLPVPDVLLSGDHGRIAAWRREQARERTERFRPELLDD